MWLVELLKIGGQLFVLWFSHKIKYEEEKKAKINSLQKEASDAITTKKEEVRSCVTRMFGRINRSK